MTNALRVRPEKDTKWENQYVHYTSAAAGLNIIRTMRLWMTNAKRMNDLSELKYGLKCLDAARSSPEWERLRNALAPHSFDILDEVWKLFEKDKKRIIGETFLACISQHLDEEDNLGRLSMWRYYAKNGGVALVFPNLFTNAAVTRVGRDGHPVYYASEEDFARQFAKMVDAVEIASQSTAGAIPNESLRWILRAMFRTIVVSTKHPGFAEERECRFVFHPEPEDPRRDPLTKKVRPIDPASMRLRTGKERVGGRLTRILKMEIKGFNYIDRVIIGPSSDPNATRKKYVEALIDQGMPDLDAQARVVCSEIPLRV